jgi:hypothetical protein
MAIQVIQRKTCDPHSDRGEEVEGETTPPIAIGKSGPMEFEMCPVCRKEMLEPLIELLTAHGRPANSLQPARRKVRNKSTPAPCPYCDETMSSLGFLNRHIDLRHPGRDRVERPEADVDRSGRTFDCPEGDLPQPTTNPGAFSSHMRRRHPELIASLPEGTPVTSLAV